MNLRKLSKAQLIKEVQWTRELNRIMCYELDLPYKKFSLEDCRNERQLGIAQAVKCLNTARRWLSWHSVDFRENERSVEDIHRQFDSNDKKLAKELSAIWL